MLSTCSSCFTPSLVTCFGLVINKEHMFWSPSWLPYPLVTRGSPSGPKLLRLNLCRPPPTSSGERNVLQEMSSLGARGGRGERPDVF